MSNTMRVNIELALKQIENEPGLTVTFVWPKDRARELFELAKYRHEINRSEQMLMSIIRHLGIDYQTARTYE